MAVPSPAAPVAPEQDDPTVWRVDGALLALLAPVLAAAGARWTVPRREFDPTIPDRERLGEWMAAAHRNGSAPYR